MRSVGPLDRDPAKFAAALNYLTRSRWGRVTLIPGLTSTELRDVALNPDTLIFFDPETASAAAAHSSIFVAPSDRLRGRFIITHAPIPATDCTFRWFAAGD